MRKPRESTPLGVFAWMLAAAAFWGIVWVWFFG